MGNEKYFDYNVINYDKYRPMYGEDIYNDIISYTKINSKSKLLEIGCGTGNATKPFLDIGASVTAIEIGTNLAVFTRKKYINYSNLTVDNISFENYITSEKYKLIYSATAFHWLDPDFGYKRCKELLESNGVLATFWSNPIISDKNPALKHAIQKLYSEYLPNIDIQSYNERYKGIQWYFKYFGYHDVSFKLYKSYRIFGPNSYLELLNTYSDTMALPENIRNEFLDKINDEIKKYGEIMLEDTTDLHMGRK